MIVALASCSPLSGLTPNSFSKMNFTFDYGPPLHDIILKVMLFYLGTRVFQAPQL